MRRVASFEAILPHLQKPVDPVKFNIEKVFNFSFFLSWNGVSRGTLNPDL